MTRLAGRTPDGEFNIVIEVHPWNEIERLCSSSGDTETGGILIGRYTADRATAIVLEVTPPPTDSQSGHAWFMRGVVGLRELLRRRWCSKERSYYIGEWHFHPVAIVELSAVDLVQMVRIAHTRQYLCKEPILVILGRRAHEGARWPTRAFVFPAGRPAVELGLDWDGPGVPLSTDAGMPGTL